jgi:hypothetical protein
VLVVGAGERAELGQQPRELAGPLGGERDGRGRRDGADAEGGRSRRAPG